MSRKIKTLLILGTAVCLFLSGAYVVKTPGNSSIEINESLNLPDSFDHAARIDILVDANEFWDRLSTDIAAAEKYAYVQTMSFEADSAGLKLADALLARPGIDRKLMADDYSRYYTSDLFMYSPKNWFNAAIREEISATEELAVNLSANGVQFKWTNPVNPLFTNFAARNHKKIIVIDDHITYLGGINFCDHNFTWHDMMIRFDSRSIAEICRTDFITTWKDSSLFGHMAKGNIAFYLFDGENNIKTFEKLFQLFDQAKDHIYVESAYLTFPFFEKLRQAKQRGVEVTIITPEQNNKDMLKQYILWEAGRSEFNLYLYQPGMNHLKAILIDDQILIAGSCNFDFLNYSVQKEISVVITDPTVINSFREKILIPDMGHSYLHTSEMNSLRGYYHYALLKIADIVMAAIN